MNRPSARATSIETIIDVSVEEVTAWRERKSSHTEFLKKSWKLIEGVSFQT